MPGVAEEWGTLFQRHPSLYKNEAVSQAFFARFIRSAYMRKIAPYASPEASPWVLEAGCGGGKFSVCLAILGCQVVALDCSPLMLANTKALAAAAAGYYGPLRLATVQQDLWSLGFSDETFDLTLNEGVVEHWVARSDRLHIMAEMARVTKRGGHVIIFVPNGAHPLYRWWILAGHPGYTNAPPMVRYSVAMLAEEMAAVGLTVLDSDGIDPWLSLSWWPSYGPLRLASRLLNKLVPLPKGWRVRLGVNLVAIGRKAG